MLIKVCNKRKFYSKFKNDFFLTCPIMHFYAKSVITKKCTNLWALKTFLTFKNTFDDDFRQLQFYSFKDDLCHLEFLDERSYVWHAS